MLSWDYVYKYCFPVASINYTMNMVSTREKKPPGNYPMNKVGLRYIPHDSFLPFFLFFSTEQREFF